MTTVDSAPGQRFLAARAAVVGAEGLTSAQRRRALTDLTDTWLASLMPARPGLALVAVGGYGRRELLPGSDLDVVLLHTGISDIARVADALFYPVWDSRLALDHSVRTTPEARKVARGDLKVTLGLLDARHIAGDSALTDQLRAMVLEDWRRDARERLPQLADMARERAERSGHLAYLIEPDLVEAHGGLRDTVVMRAVAASWLADRPHAAATEDAREWLLSVREGLHRGTGRRGDRLVLQEQQGVARMLGLLDADALLRRVSEAGRMIAYASDVTWRSVDRAIRGSRARKQTTRLPLAEGVVEQDGEVVLALDADPAEDPVLPLRLAAAAAQAGLPIAPHTLDRLAAESAVLPIPWPAEARDSLISLLGAGVTAVPVWEAMDRAGLVARWLPDWDRVRFRPQRTPIHRHTVDRHCVQAAVEAAKLARRVSRPDLLLIAALLHDLGKGWPGDHSVRGEVVARDAAARMGMPAEDIDLVALLVRHHLLLPQVATRRDIDDPTSVQLVVTEVPSIEALELLAALTEADAIAAGPLAWTPFRAGLVRELVRRSRAALSGESTPPAPPSLPAWQQALVDAGELAVVVEGSEHGCTVTVVAPDRVGLLATVAGVLALHRLEVRSALAQTPGNVATSTWTATMRFGEPPDPAMLREDIRRALDGRLDVGARLAARAERAPEWSAARPAPAPPTVALVPDASTTATVLEVRAHDERGLLYRVASAVSGTGALIRSAVVGTLGAEAVDVLYLVDEAGDVLSADHADQVHAAVAGALS